MTSFHKILLTLLLNISALLTYAQCTTPITIGAEQYTAFAPLLQNRQVGVVVNQTSILPNTKEHLVDYLTAQKTSIKAIYAPEHGFRGEADAGATVKNSTDIKTGIKIYSLYGKNKKPTPEILKGIEVMIFDIQDVGCRFYTYISTLHYVMEACAEQSIPLIILDRPNPNGDYIAGPIREQKFKSFVGMDPIPTVHGCTIGEIAQMINGEGWLKNKIKADITVIPCKNYTRTTPYSLPIKPSPNLPTDASISLYPSLCLFEATSVSIGRGTYIPFQVAGYPDKKMGTFTFTPKSIPGMSTSPRHQDKLCYGVDYRENLPHRFTLQPLAEWIEKLGSVEALITNEKWFNLLMGESNTLEQLKKGVDYKTIEESWQPELTRYKKMRTPYLLYPDTI